ncbi:hypothetical protein KRB99_000007 [Salmonella enterica]|nr:hypothetical protein [Salmonella enterica]
MVFLCWFLFAAAFFGFAQGGDPTQQDYKPEPWELPTKATAKAASKQRGRFQQWLSEHSTDVGMIGIASAIIVVAGIFI